MRITALIFAVIFSGLLCVSPLFVTEADAKCIYCKKDNVYGDCGAAPSFGDTSANPKRKHKHQSNNINCVWCGGKNYSQKCNISPDGKHQL